MSRYIDADLLQEKLDKTFLGNRSRDVFGFMIEDFPTADVRENVKGENNAEVFKNTFGIYATELWSMTENEFLEWLNSGYERW